MIPKLVEPVEWQALAEEIDREFGEGISKTVLGSRQPLYMVEGETKRLYLVPPEWIESLFLNGEPRKTSFSPRFLGKEVGTFLKGHLRLGLHVLPEMVGMTQNLLKVTGKAGEAFTYGRSILKEGVVEIEPSLERGERVLVQGEDGYCLGLAALSIDAAKIGRLAPEKLVAKNLTDIGWYIRRLG